LKYNETVVFIGFTFASATRKTEWESLV